MIDLITGECPKVFEEFGFQKKVEKWQFSNLVKFWVEKGPFLFCNFKFCKLHTNKSPSQITAIPYGFSLTESTNVFSCNRV